MAGTRTMGTTLIKKMSGSETEDLIIGDLTSIGEIGTESEEIDTTTLSSPEEYKEFIAGTKDAGEVALSGNIVVEATMSKLIALAESRAIETWESVYPSGAKWALTGFIKSFKDGEKTPDGLATFTAVIRVSGKPVFTPAP